MVSLGSKFDMGKLDWILEKIGFDGGQAGGLGKIGVTVGGQFAAQFGNFNKDIQQGKVFEGQGLIPGAINITLDEKHVKAPKSLLGKLTGKITNILQFGRDFMKSGKKVKIVVGGVAIPSATVAGQVTAPGVAQEGIPEVTIVADETDDRGTLPQEEIDEATNFETEAGEEFEILTVQADKPVVKNFIKQPFLDGSLGGKFDMGKLIGSWKNWI
ncbi:hypothetical protein CEXT_106411 [Caerostris extrusa]|uniref:Uncharacterized protein n=1 Tax=Caerostris extrusa TaxID=172846 RepID=A0AAV4NR34_CAEEX|nr:hypothetical protein CEXT_106411 [Caerostris extrusa]